MRISLTKTYLWRQFKGNRKWDQNVKKTVSWHGRGLSIELWPRTQFNLQSPRGSFPKTMSCWHQEFRDKKWNQQQELISINQSPQFPSRNTKRHSSETFASQVNSKHHLNEVFSLNPNTNAVCKTPPAQVVQLEFQYRCPQLIWLCQIQLEF